MRLGILPAAGKAERWGGYPKEMLPVSADSTFLSRAADSLQICGCDVVVVITSPPKVQWHAHHLRHMDNLELAIQKGEELWGAISTAIEIKADEYYFMMPDTFGPERPFPRALRHEFAMGLFTTKEPERFGMIRDGKIVDKQASASPGSAWGALAWKRSVVKHWQKRIYPTHTDALNDAIRVFGYGEWHLDYYYDIGSTSHYADFLLTEYAEGLSGEHIAGLSSIIQRHGRTGEYSPSAASEQLVLSSLAKVRPHE